MAGTPWALGVARRSVGSHENPRIQISMSEGGSLLSAGIVA